MPSGIKINLSDGFEEGLLPGDDFAHVRDSLQRERQRIEDEANRKLQLALRDMPELSLENLTPENVKKIADEARRAVRTATINPMTRAIQRLVS